MENGIYMKALILNGSRKGDSFLDAASDVLSNMLKGAGYEVDPLLLRDLKIASCKGCFDCWVKTPGVCSTDDEGRLVPMKMMQSDLMIYLVPITFGGFSSELKKGLDRITGTLLPFLTNVNAEIHHPFRYKKYPKILGIGILPQPDEEAERIFRTLVNRNALNIHDKGHSTVVYRSDSHERVAEKIKALLAEAGAAK
jgi:multimeric flavodoxin WrbA